MAGNTDIKGDDRKTRKKKGDSDEPPCKKSWLERWTGQQSLFRKRFLQMRLVKPGVISFLFACGDEGWLSHLRRL